MYTVHISSAQRLLVLQNMGKVFSRVHLQNICSGGMASLYSGRGRGHTYATFMHAHRRARTQAHTQAATQFNILPLKILSINKQLENYNKKPQHLLKNAQMRWLVVLLSKHTQEYPQLHASSYYDYYTYIHTIRIIKPFFFLL